jgi:histone acetyltransferase
MTRALRALQAHQQSWPFRSPVNKVEVPDYYEFIKNPMGKWDPLHCDRMLTSTTDLHTMQTNLENGEYTQVARFIQDVRLIGENCKAYNPHDSVYAKAATKLMRYFEVVLLKELEEKSEE